MTKPAFSTGEAPIKKITVKWSRYRPGLAQRVGRCIALLFHDRGNRRGWVVSSTPWPHFTPGKDPVPILQETGWAPGPVWTGGKSRHHRDSIPDRLARSQSLHRLSYPAHRWGSYTLTLSPQNNFILPKILNYYSFIILLPWFPATDFLFASHVKGKRLHLQRTRHVK